MSFSQGLSGLNAAAKALDVVGNNIANSQTAGFKSGAVAFADIFAGASGLGVQVAGVNQSFEDGGLSSTSRNLDFGISGRGFFRMESSDGSAFYGRNGQFAQDKDGYIVNMTNNLFLSGYQATGTPPAIDAGAPLGPIRIPTDNIPPQATTSSSLTGNLPAGEEDVIDTVLHPFKHTDSKSFNYSTEISTTDSQGSTHVVQVYFVQETSGAWKAYGRDSTSPDMAGSGDENYAELPLAFDSNGNFDDAATSKMQINGLSLNGAQALSVELDLSQLKRQAGDFQGVAKGTNGYAPGTFKEFQISKDGEVEVTYSNGEKQIVAQIVLADFSNTSGLESQGNNVWSETAQSGQPFYGTSGSGSFGNISGYMLESSNVDMGQEMVNMIVYQRNYQSNSQTIKTQSELLQTLVNLR